MSELPIMSIDATTLRNLAEQRDALEKRADNLMEAGKSTALALTASFSA
jgi:hypothetical protein